jgi:ABC-type uncharacterized transport system ATPase subunit
VHRRDRDPDEPFSGLDPINQQALREIVASSARQRTILFSTHIISTPSASATA